MRFAFDHILMKSWINSNQFNPERINFLRIDDFHREIFECTRVGYGATKGYVYDMVKWKILERKTAKNGVYDNVYSVKISNDFYELVQNFLLGFQEYFASSTVLFRECARKYALAQTVALTTEKNVSGTLVLSPR